MTDNKYQDFDAFMEESGAEIPAEVKGFDWKDERYILPAELSAKMVLRYTRKINTNSDTDKAQAVDIFLTNVLGSEQYEKLLDTDIGLVKLMRLVEWIFNQYDARKVEANPKVQRGKA